MDNVWLVLTNFATPLSVAFVVAYLGMRFGKGAAVRYAASVASATAVVVSYALLPDWAGWQAERFWQWLPYAVIVLGITGPIAHAEGVRWWERIPFYLAGSLAAAVLFVPNWPDLEPSPTVLIVATTLGMTALAFCLEGLAARLIVATPLVLAGSLLAIAIASAAVFSMKYGQLALLPAAALLGVGLATWLRREAGPGTLRGATLLFAFLLFAAAWPSAVEPNPAKWELLALILTPLLAWPVVLAWRAAKHPCFVT